jgi:ketosteroid isomerase-like protein
MPGDSTVSPLSRERQLVEEERSRIGARMDVLGYVAAAFFQFHSKVRIRGHKGQHELAWRATMLFRHTPAGWRVIHFHESAPLTVFKPSSRSGANGK